MAFTRNTSATDNISTQPNKPVINASALKAKFDKYGADEKAYNNDVLLPELEASTGASNIGQSNGGLGANVQTALNTIFSAGSGTIPPDGTVTNDKLATDVKVGSLATLSTTEKGSVVGAINELNTNFPVKKVSNVSNTPLVIDTTTTDSVLKTIASSPSYGGTINAIASDDTHVYVGGATTLTVRKYLKSTMALVAESPSYGGEIKAIAVDDTHVYVGGITTATVRRYLKSTMAFVDETVGYGGSINAIAIDSTHIYVGGATVFTVKRFLKSTMALVDATVSYGGIINALIIDDTHIYVGGGTVFTAKKFLKSTMAFVAETVTYGNNIFGIAQNSTHIFVGGQGTPTVRRYLKSTMALVDASASLGNTITSVSVDDTNVYATISGQYIYKTLISTMGYVSISQAYGGALNASALDTDFIYSGGATTLTAIKVPKREFYTLFGQKEVV